MAVNFYIKFNTNEHEISLFLHHIRKDITKYSVGQRQKLYIQKFSTAILFEDSGF
jgi:hypothetical protein